MGKKKPQVGGAREGAGRPAEAGSARNGAERVTSFVAPEVAAKIAALCAKHSITRGDLMTWAAKNYKGS